MPTGSQSNTSNVTSKDRTSSGPRPDSGSGTGGGGGASVDPDYLVPAGAILMWAGLLADVPRGWALCNGTNGTPDLRDKFILGWTDAVEPGDTGGSAQHQHGPGTLANVAVTAGSPAGTISAGADHTHSFTSSSNAGSPDLLTADVTAAGVAASGTTGSGGAHTHTFAGDPLATHTHTIEGLTADAEDAAASIVAEDIYPPWFKLAFIQKL